MNVLNFEPAENMGGVCRIFAIPPTSFVRLWTDHVNRINYLTVRNRDDIIDIYSIEEETIFNEEAESGIYVVSLTGVTPGGRGRVNANMINSIEKLDSGYWYVLCQDNNGYIRFLGTKDNMLTFKRSSTTGKLGDRNQIAFEFTGKQLCEAYYIQLDDIESI